MGVVCRRKRRTIKKWRSRPISRVLSKTVIPLGPASPQGSSNLPGDTAGRGNVSLFGLAPGGVCRAGPLPDSRCALTAPFHPCLCSVPPKKRRAIGGIFLLHFPSARAAQALPGTVPYGARTFLATFAHLHERRCRDCLADSATVKFTRLRRRPLNGGRVPRVRPQSPRRW